MSSKHIYIRSPYESNRFTYTLVFIIKERLGLDFDILLEGERASERVAIGFYRERKTGSNTEFQFLWDKIFDENFMEIEGYFFCGQKKAIIIKNNKKESWSLSPFGAIFFCLSRIEEYKSARRDEHDRFLAEGSIFGKYLSFPWVDYWVEEIRKKLVIAFPQLSIKPPKYHFEATYDIDIAWAYSGRTLGRYLGGLVKEMLDRRSFYPIYRRLLVALNRSRDPFDHYQRMFDTPFLSSMPKRVVFFLLGDRSLYDRNISPKNKSLQALIRHTATKVDKVGIHPSYLAHLNTAQTRKELARLARILGDGVASSRQHFLRLRLPDTYRLLIDLGIKEDYTMGYGELLGFRAGTAHDFAWYDLERECTTSLRIYPFQIMDVTLKDYLALSPKESVFRAEEIIRHIRTYGGTFRAIWHNSSFELRAWEEWQEVFEEIWRKASE